MLNNDWFDFTFVPNGDIIISLMSIISGMLGAMIIMFIGGVRLTNTNFFKESHFKLPLIKKRVIVQM